MAIAQPSLFKPLRRKLSVQIVKLFPHFYLSEFFDWPFAYAFDLQQSLLKLNYLQEYHNQSQYYYY